MPLQQARLISASLARALHDARERVPLAVLATCVAATLLAVVTTQQVASRAGERAFEISAAPIVRSVEAALRNYTSLARVSSVLFDPTTGQARSLAGRYMIGRTLSDAYPAAELFAFVRRVPHKDLPRYAGPRPGTLLADENGLPSFQLRAAPGQEVHLILEQVYPDEAAGAMLGSDLSTDVPLVAALQKVRAGNSVVAVMHAQSGLFGDGIPLLAAPVFDPLLPPGGLPVGYLLLKANFGRILGSALAGRVPSGYGVSVDLPSQSRAMGSEERLIAYAAAPGAGSAGFRVRPDLSYEREVDFGLQSARVRVTVPESSVANPMALLPVYTGLAGLAVSILIWLAVASLSSTSRRATALAQEMSAAARRSDQRFRALVESSRDWIWEVDAEYRFTYTSPNCESLLGYTPLEILGRPYADFILAIPGEAGPFESAPGGAPKAFHARVRPVRRKDGEIRMMESTGAPFTDSRGLLAGVRGIDRDVTTRIRLHDRLAELQTQLATAGHFNLASQLLAGMAHELNQPLSAIALYNQSCIRLLESGNADIGEILKYMRASADKAAQAGEIIRRLRKFMAKREISVAPVSIGAAIGDALALVETHLKTQQVEVKTDIEAGLPSVQVDTVLILQVMLNLVSNATEAMHDSALRVLRIRARRSAGGRVSIDFADSGTGVSVQDSPRLFDWYYTTKAQGMGLGLAISRSIVEAHEGTLTFQPNPEGGSVFTITLPATKQEETLREDSYH